jgi:uncharacterized membrane protein
MLHQKRVSAMADASTPPGWSYNPSSWTERLPLVGLALVGFAIAISLTYFQVGIIHALWDPFFGSASSARVTDSPVSRLPPIPDASLGAVGYAADAVLGSIGGPDRWRRMPWVVLLFSLAILGLGIVSTVLLITQGVVIRAWCTLCLCSVAISITILAMGIGEALAALQHLKRTASEGQSLWRALLGLSEGPPRQRGVALG